MSLPSRLLGGLRALLARRRDDLELEEEVRSYLEADIADRMSAGLSREEATRLARAAMGSVEAVKEGTRDAGWENHVATLWLDARHAVRSLRRTPGFAATAILTLALGIGANTAIFSVVNATLLRPLPLEDPARLVRIYETHLERGWDSFATSQPNYLDFAEQAQSFEGMAAYGNATYSLQDGGETERVVALAATHAFLPVLGASPEMGRNFLPDEDRPGGNVRVALLTHATWQGRFGGDPAVIGSRLVLTGEPYEVIGVLPADFSFADAQVDLLVPLAPDPAQSRSDHRLAVIGRLKRGVALEAARADLETVAARLAQAHPRSNEGWSVRLITFDEWIVPEESRQSLVTFSAAVACVLLIACGNVSSLLLARASARRREMAVRLAIGASRGRLLLQLLVESSVLALFGGGAGLLLAFGATRLLRAMGPEGIPRLDEVSMDASVLAYTLAVSLLAGLLFGLAPAWSVLRRRQDVHERLRESGPTAQGGARQRLRATLVVAEVAMTVVLLVAAGLLVHSFWRLQQVNPGFESRGLSALTLTLPTSASRYDRNAEAWAFYEELLSRIRALPGVHGAAVTSIVPLTGGNTSGEVSVPGSDPPVVRSPADWRIVGPDYFRTMGIAIRGREFTSDDRSGAVVIVRWDPLESTCRHASLSIL